MDATKLYLRNIDRYDLTIFTKILVDNGYTVKYDKGNNVKTVVSISKGEEMQRKTNARKFQEVFGNLGYPDLVVAKPGTTIYASTWWNEPYKEPEGVTNEII